MGKCVWHVGKKELNPPLGTSWCKIWGNFRVNGQQGLLEKDGGYSQWKSSRVGSEWFARYIYYVIKDKWWVKRLWYYTLKELFPNHCSWSVDGGLDLYEHFNNWDGGWIILINLMWPPILNEGLTATVFCFDFIDFFFTLRIAFSLVRF